MKSAHYNVTIKDTSALVEADGFAQHSLWMMYSVDGKVYCTMDTNRVDWIHVASGTFETVGYLDEMPVTISLLYAVINSRVVTFWHSPSVVCDHRIIEKWFEDNLSDKVIRANASNFCVAVDHINTLNRNSLLGVS